MADRLYIQSRRRERRKKGRHIQHIAVAIALIVDGMSSLTAPHPEHGLVVPILIVAAGVLLLATVAYEKVTHHHRAASWIEIAGAVLALAEALHRVQGKHHTAFLVLNFVVPVMIGALAWAEIRGKTEPYLQADDDGLELRTSPLFRRRIAWKGMKAFHIGERHLELLRDDGKVVRMKISDIVNREEALAWATARFQQRGLAAESMASAHSSPE
ncbi:MAG: hypothetical protein JWO56_2815 [Acidobacteria bacterium]|nr:hypothetical protein [Acidobacteriota bacterium]